MRALYRCFSACALPTLTQLTYSLAAGHGDPRLDKLHLQNERKLLIVQQTVLNCSPLVLPEAYDKYLSTRVSVYVCVYLYTVAYHNWNYFGGSKSESWVFSYR